MKFNEQKKNFFSKLKTTLTSIFLILGMCLFPAKGFFLLSNDKLVSLSNNLIFAEEFKTDENADSTNDLGSTLAGNSEENANPDSTDNTDEEDRDGDNFTFETVNPEVVATFKKESPSSKNFVSGQQNAISYRNEQLNIAFDLPKSFMLYPPNMLAYLIAADEEDINHVPFDFSFFAQSYEFIAMKDGAYPKLTLVVEKEIKDDISLDDYVISYSSALKNLGYQTNPVNESSKNIAGEEYKHLSFLITEDSETIIQDFYFRKINDLLVYFTASYKSGEEAEMENLFAGVRSYKDARPLSENSLVKDPGSGKTFKSDDSDTLFNPNRLGEGTDSYEVKDEDIKQIKFSLSDADSKLNNDFTFARERLFLPTSYLKLQEKGLFINDDILSPKQTVEAKSFVNNVEIKSKHTLPYSIKLFFFNESNEALDLNTTNVYGIELDAREKLAVDTSGNYDPKTDSTEVDSTGVDVAGIQPSDTIISETDSKIKQTNNKLYSKQVLSNTDELKSNLNAAINNSIFQAGLTFTSSNEDVKKFFDKLASNSNNKIKEISEENLITYYALDDKGTFLQMIVEKDLGLLNYKLLSFSLTNSKLPQEILNIFDTV